MYKLAFLRPHVNHSKNLARLVEILSKFGAEILIIDDGSSKEHKEILKDLKAKIIYRKTNGGKGVAMKDGFKYLIENGFTHALQIDADMQHDLLYLRDFITLSQNHPKALICANPIYGKDAPKTRLYGRKITNFWVYINTLGVDLKDAMRGLRIYPLDYTNQILPKLKAYKMDFDIEILYLFFKLGVEILWFDVLVRYDKDGVSHFRVFRDNLLISKIHAKHFFALPKFIFKRLLDG